MAMKMVFLWCGVVIGLSLLAGEAVAQIDSVQVELFLTPICDSCSMTVDETFNDSTLDSYPLFAELCISSPISFMTGIGTMVYSKVVQFSIDTTNHVFRGIQI